MIDRAVHWLLESGIQAPSGGFHGWYDMETETYPFLYAEATGYAIPLLLELGETGRAEKAGDWLIRKAYAKDRAFRSHLYYGESVFRPAMYSFDNAVCLKALLHLYRVTKGHKYLEFSWRIADFLLRMQEPNGRFMAVYPPSAARGWSVQPGAYHAKNAMGLLALAETTGESQYEGAARRVCEWTLKRQKEDGSFPTSQLHPQCYATEGLLYAGRKLRERRFLYAAASAFGYVLWKHIRRPDVLAQKIGLTKEFGVVKNKDEIKQLSTYQCKSGDKRAHGGFLFNTKHVNSWTTIFAIEALRKWSRL